MRLNSQLLCDKNQQICERITSFISGACWAMRNAVLGVFLSISILLHLPLFAQASQPVIVQAKTDYSQEPYVVEQLYRKIHFEKDGTGRREIVARIRVQSEAGVRALG